MWDERYGAEAYFYGTEPNEFLVAAVEGLSPGRALCLADGEGRNGVYLAGLGFDVTSVDISPVGLEKARRLAAARGVGLHTVAADLAAFDLGTEEWDLIVSIFCHLPQELRRDLHRRVAPALRQGGSFVLEAYTPQQLNYATGGPKRIDMLMTAADLRSELAVLAIGVCEEKTREVHEGPGHTGMAAVVQLTARRD